METKRTEKSIVSFAFGIIEKILDREPNVG